MFRFLISPRWLGLALFAAVLATVSIQLGNWQFDRREERRANNELIREHLGLSPVALDAVSSVGGRLSKNSEWIPVTVSGTYAPELEFTVKYQVRNRQAGVEVVTPLKVDSGGVVLINRGWMPSANTTQRPENIDPPPTGPVTLTGWLRTNSGAEGGAIRVSEGQVRAISTEGVRDWVGQDMYPGYIDLQNQIPPSDSSLQSRPDPDLSGGPHFFYGLQWYFFAGLAIFGYFYFAWSEWRNPGRSQAKATSET